jgi:hypothetical protein
VKETQRYTPILASQNLLRNSSGVPVGNILRRQYFKGLLGAVNYADPSNTVFGATGKTEGPHLQLNLNNAFLRFDRVYQQLVADNKTMFKQESMPTGWAVFEPAENGRLAAAMQMRGVQNADNYLDVNYTSGSINGIQITDEQLVGVSDAQFAAG